MNKFLARRVRRSFIHSLNAAANMILYGRNVSGAQLLAGAVVVILLVRYMRQQYNKHKSSHGKAGAHELSTHITGKGVESLFLHMPGCGGCAHIEACMKDAGVRPSAAVDTMHPNALVILVEDHGVPQSKIPAVVPDLFFFEDGQLVFIAAGMECEHAVKAMAGGDKAVRKYIKDAKDSKDDTQEAK